MPVETPQPASPSQLSFDEQMKRAIAASLDQPEPASNSNSLEDEEMARALAASKAQHQAEEQARAWRASNQDPQGYRFWHYNGLDTRDRGIVRVRGLGLFPFGGAAAPELSEAEQERENINRARRIKTILQTRTNSDGKPEYLVVCHPDGSMEHNFQLPADETWRCRDCHLKDPPNFRARNPITSEVCRECCLPYKECGVCHWLARSELSEAVRREWDRGTAPAILEVLRRRWPMVRLWVISFWPVMNCEGYAVLLPASFCVRVHVGPV
ncbi:uncharacterized protein MONBRDRAFT_8150 [Monosiga brevicollis MX1]|uniref:Uncharacterized protein n=1 Tax=Monosiga brevicollis TaxID=81824 RepID=A9UZ67_MONBE|nr:uncharacterized protein MONBRDRAFT_8150 [Monosiga brevicollis MX1]EDQ89313.1 predicted protein [Monosiga brevicollis MX1]|eukprot:XP_001745889.1 hypothetical protein [Monosiga brevicollis MX1]